MTCRDEVLAAFGALESRHGRSVFEPAEVIAEVLARGSRFAESTIRTHSCSRMCTDAPANHATRYPDRERVAPARYRRIGSAN